MKLAVTSRIWRPYLIFAGIHFLLTVGGAYVVFSEAVEASMFASDVPQWVESLEAITTALLLPIVYPVRLLGFAHDAWVPYNNRMERTRYG